MLFIIQSGDERTHFSSNKCCIKVKNVYELRFVPLETEFGLLYVV